MKVVFKLLIFVANYSRTSLQLTHSSEIGALAVKENLSLGTDNMPLRGLPKNWAAKITGPPG